MNFQDRMIEVSARLRARATSLANAAGELALNRAALTKSIATLSIAGSELNKVARRHASRFVRENSALAIAAGKDIGAIARSTYTSLSARAATKVPARKTRSARKPRPA